MGIFETKLLEAIDEIVLKRIEQHSHYNKTIKATIIQLISGNIYEIQVQGSIYTAKAINSAIYSPGDLVYVLIINNNFSEKIILSLVP